MAGGKLVSIGELSLLTGFVERTVVKKLGKIKPVEKGTIGKATLYNSKEALRAIYLTGEAGQLDGIQEKARLDKLRADKAELELLRSQGKLVDIKEVCEHVENELTVARQKLYGIPHKVAKDVAMLENPKEIQALIYDELTQIFTEIRDYEPPEIFELPEKSDPKGSAASDEVKPT